jgi:hypothetical protein
MNLLKDIQDNNMAKSEGLGDTIAKITRFFGIDKLADKIAHMLGYEDCGCSRRKNKLNKLFSYKKKK